MTKDNETKTITLKQSTGFNISLVILAMSIGAIITFTTFIDDIKTRSVDNHNRIVEMEQDINKMQAEKDRDAERADRKEFGTALTELTESTVSLIVTFTNRTGVYFK